MNPPVPRTPFAPALEGARLTDDLGYQVAADFGDFDGEYRALRDGNGIVDRSTRGLVTVTGQDALSFLNSLVSQDIGELADGQWKHSLLLQPQGKLEADLRIMRVGDACWLDCEVGMGERVTAALNRFKIRVDATIEDHSDEFGCLTLGSTLGVEFADQRDVAVLETDDTTDVIGPLESLTEVWTFIVDEGGVPPVGHDAYEAYRIEAGIPRQGLDIDDKTIPQEAFLERDAVSFTKGCFLGQELVCRIDTRGHVNRYLRGVVVLDNVEPPRTAEVVSSDGKVVGSITSVASSPGVRAPIALAMVRHEVALPSLVTLQWPGGSARAEVRELPMTEPA